MSEGHLAEIPHDGDTSAVSLTYLWCWLFKRHPGPFRLGNTREQLSRDNITSGSSLTHLWNFVFLKYWSTRHPRELGLAGSGRDAALRMFMTAFLFACFLFWWLATLLYRMALKVPDPVHDWTLLLSFASVMLFLIGYLLPVARLRWRSVPPATLEATEDISFLAIKVLSIPAIALALYYAKQLSTVSYGSSGGIPFFAQAVFYPYLFFGLMYLGSVKTGPATRRKIVLTCALMIIPRVLITLHYGRFFAAEAIVPVVFLSVARGWIHLRKRRVAGLALLVLALIFVPAYTRGDKLGGQNAMVNFLATGSTLKLFQDNEQLSLAGRCPVLLVSMTAAVVPYHALGVCTISYEGLRHVPATLDRILTVNQVGSATKTGAGTGSNYMLELYLSGGMTALLIGSIAFGYACKLMVWHLADRSIFTGIWAMCLARALLAPRGNLGYVFELIPGYVVATLFAALLGIMLQAALGPKLEIRGASPSEIG